MDPSYLVRRWWLLPLTFVVTAGSIAVNLHDPVPIVLGVLAALVLFSIDRLPQAVAVNGVLVGAYFVAGGDNGPIFFTVPVAALLAALAVEVRAWLPGVVASGIAVWAGLLVRGLREDVLDISLWQSLGIGALVAAAAAIGTGVRTRRGALKDRRDRAIADEKLRMAQDLHDGVGHGLAVIAMQAGAALHVLDREPEKARASLEAIRATSKEALDALRRELAAMSGEVTRRPAAGPDELPALFDRVRAAGLRVDVTGDPSQVPAPLGAVVYAVAQEALTNVLRHAGADSVQVRWAREGDLLVLSVRDDGRGGDVQDEGMGIGGMRARVERLGGSLRAGPHEGGGFEVVAELPPLKVDQ
jgi:signal transduction histidine kinase